jgi:hypothetical protein
MHVHEFPFPDDISRGYFDDFLFNIKTCATDFFTIVIKILQCAIQINVVQVVISTGILIFSITKPYI